MGRMRFFYLLLLATQVLSEVDFGIGDNADVASLPNNIETTLINEEINDEVNDEVNEELNDASFPSNIEMRQHNWGSILQNLKEDEDEDGDEDGVSESSLISQPQGFI